MRSNKLTLKEKAERRDALMLVERFNKLFPVGAKVTLRKAKSRDYEECTVKHPAYALNDTEPVAFFDGISGAFMITEDFVKYPTE